MIAMHADEIYAGRYSLVGSIGAILSTWNFADAINKLGVQHHAYASGKLKSMLNPYIPLKKDDETKVQSLVSGMGKVFAEEVIQRRGKKLATNVNHFTGEVWSGQDAKNIGLIDEIGTLDEVISKKFGKDVNAKEFNKKRRELSFFKTSVDLFFEWMVSAVTDKSSLSPI